MKTRRKRGKPFKSILANRADHMTNTIFLLLDYSGNLVAFFGSAFTLFKYAETR